VKRITFKDKPDIEYPCQWVFKVFGTSEELLRDAVEEIMPGTACELTLSRSSRRGRYVSMNLELTVVSDPDRAGIYEALSAHARILLVL
jgi:uncharacterized protein